MWSVSLDESLITGELPDTWDSPKVEGAWNVNPMNADAWSSPGIHRTPVKMPTSAAEMSPTVRRSSQAEGDSVPGTPAADASAGGAGSSAVKKYRPPSTEAIQMADGAGGSSAKRTAVAQPKEESGPGVDLLMDNRFTKTFHETINLKPPSAKPSYAFSPLQSSPVWSLKSPTQNGPWPGVSPSHPRGRRAFRDFNNIAKMWLIQHHAPSTGFAVLDLCCRRGNDIHKWHQTSAKYLLGCDPSPELIQDANDRLKAKRPSELHAEFFVGALTCPEGSKLGPWVKGLCALCPQPT